VQTTTTVADVDVDAAAVVADAGDYVVVSRYTSAVKITDVGGDWTGCVVVVCTEWFWSCVRLSTASGSLKA